MKKLYFLRRIHLFDDKKKQNADLKRICVWVFAAAASHDTKINAG